jgi:Protein of unknown function (DUF3072)
LFSLCREAREQWRIVSFRRPGPSKNSDAMTAGQPMTAEQAATLKRLAKAAYELDAFKPNLTRAEADLRIAVLTAKLKLLDGPPHTL